MKAHQLVIFISLLSCGTAVAQDDLVDLVVGLLAEQDKDVRALAFDQIRKEAKGEAATKKFADLLTKFPAETQIGLLSALADRGDNAAAPAVRNLLSSTQDEAVRVAAIKALGPLGDSNDLAVLAKHLAAAGEPVREAARASLIQLPTEASAVIAAELGTSPPATRVALLEVLTARRAREVIPVVLEAARDEDANVRKAAIAALSELAAPEQIPALAQLVLQLDGRDREAAEKAIAAVCQRIPDKAERAAPLLAAMQGLGESRRVILLSTLGRVGGPTASQVVDEALASSSTELQEAGLRALCNWPDGSVTSRLLKIARTDESPQNQKLAFQALVRTAPLADERTDRRRLDTLRTVFAMCSTDAERKQVLDRAKAIRTIETLRFLVPFLDQPEFAQQACLTVVELAHHSGLRESNKEEFHRVLDRVLQISKDATVKDRAQRYKTGQTWVRPKKSAEEPEVKPASK